MKYILIIWLTILEKGIDNMLDKKYNHEEVENNKYEKWIAKNYFKCDENSNKPPFCIVL